MVVSQTEFPKTIAAAHACAVADDHAFSAQWALGDALIAECGAPGQSRANNGSTKKLRRVSEVLKHLNLKLPCSFEWLRKLRACAAHRFTHGNRLTCVCWTVHDAAGDPETLAAALKETKKHPDQDLTVSFVKDFRARQKRKKEEKDSRERPDLAGKSREERARELASEGFCTEVGDDREWKIKWTKRIQRNDDQFSDTHREKMAVALERDLTAGTALLEALRRLPEEFREAAE